MKESKNPPSRLVTETWDTTLLVTSNSLLQGFGVREWCRINACSITVLDHPSDIIAIPYFVAIVDRDSMYNDVWSTLIDFEDQLHLERSIKMPGDDDQYDRVVGVEPTLIVLYTPNPVKIPRRGTTSFISPQNCDCKLLLARLLDYAMLNCLLAQSKRLDSLDFEL